MSFSRGLLLAGAVLAVLAGALALFPDPAARLGLDFWALPDFAAELQRDAAYAEELDRANEEEVRRVFAKQEAVLGVLEGRLTLWQAAARFRVLDDAPPRFTPRKFPGHSPMTPEERCCREVIAWAEGEEARRPGGGEGVAGRLAAELEEALRHGPLSLPAPDLDEERTPPRRPAGR